MRGGVEVHHLLYNTDTSDIDILNTVVEENIDTTKKTGLPLL
jgi:hypothetical protein